METKPDFERKRRDIQFIVNDGIVYSKRDIMNLLWDLGYVSYYQMDGENVLNQGKGFIMRVSANVDDPTLFLNGRLYINVNSFDYMRVRNLKNNVSVYELNSEDHIIKLIPDNKKSVMPPFRYIADSMVGMGVMGEAEFTQPESTDEGADDLPEDFWRAD